MTATSKPNPFRLALAFRARCRSLRRVLSADNGHTTRLLRDMGPPAEHAVLSGFQKLTDFRVRIELCHVLSAIGTEASLNALREVAGREGDGVVAGAAADALRGISERE